VGDEIQLISDGNGLAVIGSATGVERFLSSQGLSSKELAPKRLGTVLGSASAAAQAGSGIAASSGRWVQLTEESTQLVRKFGLMESKTPGISHAMVGRPGDIKSWIQIVDGPGSLTAMALNPAALASVATFMAQRQMQASIDELKEYLAQIDEKVDDILRAQKDAVVADMIGVDLVIEEAMTVRDQVGRVSDITWSKVQSTAATIARTQAYALRQLDALAEKLERKTDMGELIKATKETEAEVQDWLAVIARCFQLQDALGVLELDRVLDAAPDELDQHRLGLKGARQNRLDVIARTTAGLIARMTEAASWANAKVLLNPFDSPALVRSSNKVVTAVVDFQGRVGIESDRQGVDARRWLAAIVDVKDKAVETSVEGVGAAKRLGAETLDKAQSAKDKALDSGAEGVAQASEVTGKFFSGIAERAHRRRGEVEERVDDSE